MRWLLWASMGVLGTVAVLGLARNGGNKFVRTNSQQGCIANYANIFGAEESNLLVCCTGGEDDADVCIGGRSEVTKTLTSLWSFLIPLLGLAANAACDHLTGGVTAERRRVRRNRFFLYVAVILLRTGVLYFALNALQGLLWREASSDCWYAQLRRNETCGDQFDFSDHAVLGVCQYFAIQVFEMYCIAHEYSDAMSSPVDSKDSRGRRPSLSVGVIVAGVPLAVCAVVSGYSLALVYDTTAYFHTRGETVAALLLSWMAVVLPLLRVLTDEGGGWGRGGGGVTSSGGPSSEQRARFIPCSSYSRRPVAEE